MSQQDNNNMAKHFYRASAEDFGKIPGSPIAYWVSEKMRSVFDSGNDLKEIGNTRQGMATSDNNRFLRYWAEVNFNNSCLKAKSRNEAANSFKKWFPYNKGGDFRKWYGNSEFFVNWESDGRELLSFAASLYGSPTRTIKSISEYFKPCISWSKVSSGNLAMRFYPEGYLFDVAGCCIFSSKNDDLMFLLGYSNTIVVRRLLASISPTINFEAGQIASLPILNLNRDLFVGLPNELIAKSKADWDSYEVSWDFTRHQLLNHGVIPQDICATYNQLRIRWLEMTLKVQRLEEANNSMFIDAYGLQNELAPEVPLNEITLTCNPHYRYGGNLSEQEREDRLQSDSLTELISYAIGCMMGRYSLDREGLVYAHAGNEGFKTLVEEGAYATFTADGDGILPLTSEAWFEDDVAARVEQFVRTVWGAEQLEENLAFIADSLCLAAIKPVKKGGETSRETIRRYLSTQFYKDHLKTYKKRPIYWLFSSGKEKAFECLVYLHRYNEATLPRMRTEYVTPLLGQMASRIERKRMEQTEASTAEAKRIAKEIDSLTKQLSELRAFDDQLKHHADMRITLDLDDGVKVNYGKFGTLLSDVKAITGDKGE